jgi:hypothetical protein
MNIPDDWESLVDVAREITADMDNRRWLLGDIAGLAERRHGQGSIKELATAIRMSRHKTLYEYERVARFYDVSTRGEYPLLSWSHYREATRLGSQENARALLAQAHDEDRPVAWLAKEVKKRCGEKVTPEKVLDVTAAIADLNGDLILLRLPKGEGFKLSNLSAVRVAMWQTDAPAPTRTSRELLGSGDRIRRIG